MVIGREARGLGARAAFPSGEVFRDPGFSGATAALHRSGPSSSVWRGSLRTSRQLLDEELFRIQTGAVRHKHRIPCIERVLSD